MSPPSIPFPTAIILFRGTILYLEIYKRIFIVILFEEKYAHVKHSKQDFTVFRNEILLII